MSTAGQRKRWLRPAAVVGCVASLVAGCGSGAPPVEAVPTLDTRLSAVDRAIADHAYRQARREIQRLVSTTVAARESGDLEPEAAEPILAAAASLTSALRREQRTPASPAPGVGDGEPAPERGAGLSEEEREKRQEEREKRREEREKKREELQKKREELQKKLEEQRQNEDEEGGGEEGGGNGHSSEHGPDDDHGD